MAGHDVCKRHAVTWDFENMKIVCSRSSNASACNGEPQARAAALLGAVRLYARSRLGTDERTSTGLHRVIAITQMSIWVPR
jgi:hypothetical protein